jgi:hypothetical protein
MVAGCKSLQVRRLDVLDERERELLGVVLAAVALIAAVLAAAVGWLKSSMATLERAALLIRARPWGSQSPSALASTLDRVPPARGAVSQAAGIGAGRLVAGGVRGPRDDERY